MYTKIMNWWYTLRSSFWLVPAVMAAAAIVLSFLTIALDEMVRERFASGPMGMYKGGADGARTLLSTIAGSMITIAGVTFSITIVSLALASSQFGSRLLKNFIRDTGNQVVLGTFIATFIYCLLILRTVKEASVPVISTTVGVVLGLSSLGVLIYFIHHISVAIQADSVIASVYRELKETVHRFFPDTPDVHSGERGRADLPTATDFEERSCEVTSAASGYLKALSYDGIMKIAVEEKLQIQLPCRPGGFIVKGDVIARVRPKIRDYERLAARINSAFILGTTRTPEQDPEFAINQLVEVALRALSPGINDTFTALTCIDWLGAALCDLVEREFPSPYKFDDEGNLRLLTDALTFEGVVAAGFNQIRQSARRNAAVTIRLLETIAVIAGKTVNEEDRNVLGRQADIIVRGSREGLSEESDRKDAEERYSTALKILGGV